MTQTNEETAVLEHYRRLLGANGRSHSSGAESTNGSIEAASDLFESGIDERLDATRKQLRRIVKDYLGDEPALYEIAERIVADGKSGLTAAGRNHGSAMADPSVLSGLEVIVRSDGSRPSFMVRNGEPDLATSPVGAWRTAFDDEPDRLRLAISCVGRIDDPAAEQGFQGTGCLIGENLIMTNRHVLQAIASQDDSGTWTLKPDISIDFCHEFRLPELVRRREITRVVFAGAKPIDPFRIDHDKLDLALIELARPATKADRPPHILAVDPSPDWGTLRQHVFIVGYPGAPDPTFAAPSLLELLFKSTFGCKRIAPGTVMTAAGSLPNNAHKWSLGHDATTLGGNSGSAVILMGRKRAAAGLHYGGRWREPRENWCHVLGLTLDQTDGQPGGRTLRSILDEHGVQLQTGIV
jgi:hypothetical protein